MAVQSIPKILQVSDSQFSQAIDFLKDFVAIPTISNTDNPEYKKENLEKGAEFAANALEKLDFSVKYVTVHDSPPYVIAEKIVDKLKPTVLLYAHYDIQPVDRKEWATDPFKLEEKNGRLYGRGSSDDKGGIVTILTAIKAFKEAGETLPVNVRILFEGEEEFESRHMESLLQQQASALNAKALVVMDGLNKGEETGSLMNSTRGCVNINLEVTALKEKPMHSGLGCLGPDPVMALSKLLSSLEDPRKIPGFMDGFKPMNDQERKMIKQSSQSTDAYRAEIGIVEGAELRGDPNASIDERIVEEPSLTILNSNSGKPKGGNSLQNIARAEVGIRVLPGQDPNKVAQSVVDYIKAQKVLGNLPLKIEAGEGGWAWKADVSQPFSQKYLAALKENFKRANITPCGGSLPLMHQFQEHFREMEMIVPAVEDEKTSAHSHNESQDLGVFRNAINSLISFLKKAGEE